MSADVVTRTEELASPEHEGEDPQLVELESLCVNCYGNGTTRIMATQIPFYKEVVVMSFCCDICGYENNELKSCGVISNKGIKLLLTVTTTKDLNRKVVRTENASISIPEVELEISSKNQKGEVTTIEGIIDRVILGLEQEQPLRKIQHPIDAEKIDLYILRLAKLKDVEKNGPFTFTVEDISGNSHIENPFVPHKDPNMTISHFNRTTEQDHELGFFTHEEVSGEKEISKSSGKDLNGFKNTLLQPIIEGDYSLEKIDHGEVLTFRTNCPECNAPCETNMKMTDIPHFKEVLIMATNCEQCGHRTNEVKSGGGIEKLGIKIELKIRSKDDFSRDVLKSDSCNLLIPELDLESGSGSLCGRFTTAEGLISAMRFQLAGKDSMVIGDSADDGTVNKMKLFIAKLDKVLEGLLSVTLVLDDPAGNSYVQSLNDDGTLDEGLKITRYERNFDQNEDLGLNDMKTDNYRAA